MQPSQLHQISTLPTDIEQAHRRCYGEDPAYELNLYTHFVDKVIESVQWHTLFSEQDDFELQHLERLSTEYLRVGCRQILEVKQAITPIALTRIDQNQEDDESNTSFIDETHYPSGGIAGVTNRGPIENLVLSELVYMDKQSDFDLFDMRYVEGELLYYKRDAGVLRRKRRLVHLIFDLQEIFGHKSLGYDWQFSTLIQGMALRIIEDLFSIFEKDSLHVHLHYLQHQPQKHTADINVLKVLLKEPIEQGWLKFFTPNQITDTSELVSAIRKTYFVVFAQKYARKWVNMQKKIHRIKQTHTLLLFHICPDQPMSDFHIPSRGASCAALSEVKDRMLINLVG